MKKLFLLLLISLSGLYFTANSQTTTTCNANFTWNLSGYTVKFLPETTTDSPYVLHYWSFGDGVSGNSISPYHTYPSTGGTYVIIHYLIRKNPNGVEVCRDSVSKEIIFQAECVTPSFIYSVDSLNYLKIKFTNTTYAVNSTDSISWMFGDGTYSNDINATHIYKNAGTYKVCLLIKRKNTATSCVKESCKDIVIPAPCNISLNVVWKRDSVQTNKVQFYYAGNNTTVVDSIKWNFGDGYYSTEKAPVHIFAVSGLYKVCLIVTRNGIVSCAKDTCMNIQIQAPVVCNIQSYFIYKTDSTVKNKIYFTNATVNFLATDSVYWTFGDGSVSRDLNPAHTYPNYGTYKICLVVKRNTVPGTTPCVSEICKTITVGELPCLITPAFTWKIDSLNKSKIFFTNTTAVTTTNAIPLWSFGDSTSSTSWNTYHIYTKPGIYNVCLTITLNNTCIKTICNQIVINFPCDFTPAYNWKTDSVNSKKISFANTTLLTTSSAGVNWSFGDGVTATSWNAVHEYTAAGKYYVCLRIESGTNCVKYICDSITVTVPPPACDLVPAFTWVKDNTNSRKIIFTNTTPVTTTKVQWFFGDNTSATTWNAVHEYVLPGKYYVCLRMETGTNCIKYKCDSITVSVPATDCNQLSQYSIIGITTNTLSFAFTPTSIVNDVAYTWTFGDGTGYQGVTATHNYANAGTYTTCLTAFKNAGCASTTCKPVGVLQTSLCNDVSVKYEYKKDSLVPNKVNFYAISNSGISQQAWTISKAVSGAAPVVLYQNNPYYYFADTGYYKVCLNIVTMNGCRKEYCNYIHIEKVLTTCSLQVYPNPAYSQITINVQENQPEVIHGQIFDIQNILMKQFDQAGVLGNNVVTVNVQGLVAGYYTVRLIYGNNVCYAKFQKL